MWTEFHTVGVTWEWTAADFEFKHLSLSAALSSLHRLYSFRFRPLFSASQPLEECFVFLPSRPQRVNCGTRCNLTCANEKKSDAAHADDVAPSPAATSIGSLRLSTPACTSRAMTLLCVFSCGDKGKAIKANGEGWRRKPKRNEEFAYDREGSGFCLVSGGKSSQHHEDTARTWSLNKKNAFCQKKETFLFFQWFQSNSFGTAFDTKVMSSFSRQIKSQAPFSRAHFGRFSTCWRDINTWVY